MRRPRALALAATLGTLTTFGCVSTVPPAGPPASTPDTAPSSDTAPSAGGTPSPATPVESPPPGRSGAGPTVPTATSSAGTAPPPSTGAAPAPSGTGSIVYVLDWNLWIVAPDGSGARALTTDGTELIPYHSPSQAPDGSIYAVHGTSSLVRLDRAGQPLDAPVTLPTLENGAEALAVSPDGARIAYVTTGFGTEIDPRFGNPTGTFIYGGMDVVDLAGVSVPGAAAASMLYPDWLDADTLVVADGVTAYVRDIGGADPRPWIDLTEGCLIELDCPADDGPAANVSATTVSPDGRLVAYTYDPYFGDGGRVFATLDAGTDTAPTPRCLMSEQVNATDSGSFSPDGSRYTLDDTRFDPDTFDTIVGEGVFVMEVDLDADDCGASTGRLLAPGGSQPDWAPIAP